MLEILTYHKLDWLSPFSSPNMQTPSFSSEAKIRDINRSYRRIYGIPRSHPTLTLEPIFIEWTTDLKVPWLSRSEVVCKLWLVIKLFYTACCSSICTMVWIVVQRSEPLNYPQPLQHQTVSNLMLAMDYLRYWDIFTVVQTIGHLVNAPRCTLSSSSLSFASISFSIIYV